MPNERPPRVPPPLKRLGQHFLHDRGTLERIVDALAPEPTDTVVEIGPGRGAMTDLLAERAGRLIAVEVDRKLVPVLRGRYADRPHVEIVEADFLHVDVGALVGGRYLLIGNVPYYITTPIIFRALEPPRPERAVFLVQWEVAERVTAPAGADAYGALSVNVQGFAEASIAGKVRAGAFNPPPKVDSAVLRLVPRETPVVVAEMEQAFRELVQGAFALRRKQMQRVVRTLWSLSPEEANAALTRAGIDPMVRPEVLTPDDFARLLATRWP